MIKRNLPETDSITELANFWDKNDITDFEDGLEAVPEPVFRKDRKIQVHLEQKEFESLEFLAHKRGLEHKELVREWILEKLQAA